MTDTVGDRTRANPRQEGRAVASSATARSGDRIVKLGIALAFCGLSACSSGGAASPEEDDSACQLGTQQQSLVSRAVLPAPPAPPDEATFAPLPHPVPVLLFHDICPERCAGGTYGMTRAELYRTLRMLRSAGYTSVSTADYVRFLRSDWEGLPSQPILITFDDSRLDSYVGADDILRTTGDKATMFAITGNVADPKHMNWSELSAAQASGRWDIQLHGHDSHVKIDGHPFMAYRLPGETFEGWQARTEGDIWKGLAALKANVPGFVQLVYALPFGDYGQWDTNDPRIPVELRSFFAKRFAAWFVQPSASPDFSVTVSDPFAKERLRYTVRDTTTADTVYAWLNERARRRAKTPSL
jgi:hypothetical protein